MESQDKPIANPLIVFREEFDDWAVLFDPDSGDSYGLNPVSAFIWKHLDGKHTASDILKSLKGSCDDVPDSAGNEITEFIESLIEKGLAGFEFK